MELSLATLPENDAKVLLIDLENYPKQINELPNILNEYHQVVVKSRKSRTYTQKIQIKTLI